MKPVRCTHRSSNSVTNAPALFLCGLLMMFCSPVSSQINNVRHQVIRARLCDTCPIGDFDVAIVSFWHKDKLGFEVFCLGGSLLIGENICIYSVKQPTIPTDSLPIDTIAKWYQKLLRKPKFIPIRNTKINK